MKTLTVTQPAVPGIPSRATRRLNLVHHIEWMGGVCYHPSQAEMLAGYLKNQAGIKLTVPNTANNPFNGGITLDEFVKTKTEEIERNGIDKFLICHSLGIHAGVRIACNTPLIKGIVSIATGAHRGIWVKPEPRAVCAEVIRALLTGKPFNIPKRHQEFFLDGAVCSLGSASGKVFRRAVSPFFLGYKTPMMKTLQCRTHMIIPMGDKLVPIDSADQIAKEHGPEGKTFVEGGHFAHCDPRYSREIAHAVIRVLGRWTNV